MTQAKCGDTVKVHYTGKLKDGTVFDSSFFDEPLQFTIGNGAVMSGLEKAVVGMRPGELKRTEVPAEEAYGPHLKELVVVVQRDTFPDDLEPQVGLQFQTRREDGQMVVITVIEVSDSTVTLDANHPLASEDLTFAIVLVEIVPTFYLS